MLAFWLFLLALLPSARAQETAPEMDLASIEDYRVLESMAQEALAGGDEASARALFETMLERQEIHRYLAYRDGLREALILERLGQHEAAEAAYRASFEDDIMRTVQVLRILSVHPSKGALVDEAYAWLRGQVELAKSGRDGRIYTTSKGDPRYLDVMTQGEALEALGRGEQLRYCYIESLDLTLLDDQLLASTDVVLNRCVLGSLTARTKHFQKLVFKGFILGDLELGKQWAGKPNQSAVVRPSSFDVLSFRDAILMGRANLAGIQVGEKTAGFQMVVFEGPADFKAAELHGPADFRFAAFRSGANFKDSRLHEAVYFGGSRYLADTVFTGLYSERLVYFNSATFEAGVAFNKCEWLKGATFEDSRFEGPVSLETSQIGGRLNLSRVVFEDTVSVREVQSQGLDMLGTVFRDNASFVDARFDGKVRLSLDQVTRARHMDDPSPLLSLYRDYQGDEAADEPLTTRSSYGVQSVDDLTARIERDVSFANTVFSGYAVFERVAFGQPGQQGLAQFYNTQFLGESHFERTTWHSAADFSTIFGNEIAFNEARFLDTLVLDDANIPGRLTLTDVDFEGDADWSWYGAEIRSFEVNPEQVDGPDGHLLFYEKCARDQGDWQQDLRIRRQLLLHPELDEQGLRRHCYGAVFDEFVGLNDSFGERAMVDAEDEAYWWSRHHQTMARWDFGGPLEKAIAAFNLLLFELCFGWGVRLSNLGWCTLAVTTIFAWLYRRFCPDTVLMYHGAEMRVRDVSFAGLFFVSLQSLVAINTGWDFGEDDHRFRYLNTAETLVGFIILTFFVGAYTRMILA
jgi:hypothetical protein